MDEVHARARFKAMARILGAPCAGHPQQEHDGKGTGRAGRKGGGDDSPPGDEAREHAFKANTASTRVAAYQRRAEAHCPWVVCMRRKGRAYKLRRVLLGVIPNV